MEKVRINEEKISPFSIFLSMFWNSDEDVEKEWKNEPNRKILEATIADVDKKAPKILPVLDGKIRKLSNKLKKLTKSDNEVSKIKDTKTKHKNKDSIEKELGL